jgi:predicted nucleic-acid-binding Zn-ribbon protein
MADNPVFDYTCSQCGATETYSLVPAQRASGGSGNSAPTEIDFTCAKCGATETYSLVPANRAV